jgi:tetratricopeptide (TPR) repeat protein
MRENFNQEVEIDLITNCTIGDFSSWTQRFVAWLLAALWCVTVPAGAANLAILDDPSLGKDRYERCLELAKRNPHVAVDQAGLWYKEGGGGAALHCAALALVDLKRYGDAALKLEAAAHEQGLAAARRGELLDQAGNAWLLDGQPDKADMALSAALSFTPQDEDVLADRARARGLKKDWSGAEADLSAVLSLDPNRADALVLRASARHAQGRLLDARADIDRALDIDPGYPEALVERGTMEFEAGDAAGARADWLEVMREAPGTGASAEAATRLKLLAASKH